ncbi:MAG: hypothetical protein NUV63_06560 [Gallionella sp.]|nr:hypothetical protein [Gallionella sp.]
MTPVVVEIAASNDDDKAQRSRVEAASPRLRGRQLDDDDSSVLVKGTVVRSGAYSDFLIKLPNSPQTKVDSFKAEQLFEGVVTSVDYDNKSFWVRLRDLSRKSGDEEAEILMAEVPGDDWPLIIPGAIFEWNIGREVRDRQVRRVSDIRFRRYFSFSQETVKAAEKKAHEFAALLSEVNDYPTEYSS